MGKLLGSDVSAYPKKKATSASDLSNLGFGSFATLEQLFSTLPELGKLFEDVYDSEPSWINAVYDTGAGHRLNGKQAGSSYIKPIDQASKINPERLARNGWELTEIEAVEREEEGEPDSKIYRARVDHDAYE